MGDMEFAKAHNSAIFLKDPPAVHNDLKFIVDGLKKSCLVHALTTSLAIYQSLIKEFWRNAVVKKNGQGEKFIETTIEDKKIQEVLEHMGYKGTFPPTIKKLLPPCWKYLAHVFVSYISGRRSGANEISLANTGAIAALAAGCKFNFSKFIMNEMILNLEGSKRDKFWMYPRFLQIILNVTHPELQRGNDTLDFKSIGPSAFGLMKQKREEQSMPMENEDISHSPPEPDVEEIHDSPTAYVVDEHDNQKENDSKSYREDDDDDLYEDVEFLKEIDFTGINDDIPTNIEFDIGDEDFDPFLDIPSSHVNKVNEVASLATKTRDGGNVFKILFSTSKPLEIAPSQGDVTSEIPPSVPLISISAPVSSDSTEPQTSQSSIKTSQPLESLKAPAVRCAPQVLSTITATSTHSPPKKTDEASIRLAKHLAQSSPSSSRGKGISFKEGRSGDDKSSSPYLREEIGILRQELIEKSIQMDQLSVYIFDLRAKGEEKNKQINDLQMSLGYVLANYFNLKNVLYDAFGEKVKALFQKPHEVVDPPSVQSPPATDDLPVNPPAPRTTKIVNRSLFMKNSNENRKAKDPVLTVTDLKKREFGDEYGDRTGIRMWAFDPVKNLWVVKRKLGASECYKSTHDFNSWTKTDLAELSRAPFHNPSENPSASNFKRFLDRQVRENFPSMKTAKALYRKDKDVLDPESGKPMKIILWPATKKQQEIPIPQHFHEGYLDNIEFWAYDDETATAAIKFKNREHILRLINAKDLLRFRERDIRTLASHQIICRKDVMEAAAKEFTAMVATIINGRLWMGSMGSSDLRLFEKLAEKPNE
ncbi:unnamed protein product [Lactuca saligna]|uniref:Uncharacterized protein n=1 Tax=Lactuca saligna TaxID=75948 RepID=A0AA35Y088_LACSI|nr:unnamed protein product [Lactuca saligna]